MSIERIMNAKARIMEAENEQWKQRAETAEALVKERDARIAELEGVLQGIAALTHILAGSDTPRHSALQALGVRLDVLGLLKEQAIKVVEAAKRCEAGEDVINAACDALAAQMVEKDG